MPCLHRAADALCALVILAQLLDPDPSLDQAHDVGLGVVRFEHGAGEVDEPPDRCLGVAAAAALEFMAER